MSDFINTIDLLGDEAVTKALIERTITEFNDDVLTSVGEKAFRKCAALTRVDFPNVKTIDYQAFSECSALTSMNLPNATSIGGSAFNYCTALTDVNLPNATSIDSSFSNCSSLEYLDLPKVSTISGGAFQYCKKLKTLILRNSTMCTLDASYVFNNGTPFYTGGTGGTLLVPRATVTEYQNATNWAAALAYNEKNRVLALEDYTIDGTITGAIDWDKLNGGN